MVHLGFDLALISIILAALRRHTGYTLSYDTHDLKNYIKKYLYWGEYLYDKIISVAKTSSYFKKETQINGMIDGLIKRVEEINRDFKEVDIQGLKQSHLD